MGEWIENIPGRCGVERDAGVRVQQAEIQDGAFGGHSWLLQLDVSNVEAAHVLVGALEPPGDVFIHGAVI